MITLKQISVRYDNVIKEYLNKGYIINPLSRVRFYTYCEGGSPITSIDLFNPNEPKTLIRVSLLTSSRSHRSKTFTTLEISVFRCNFVNEAFQMLDTRLHEPEIIYNERFYSIVYGKAYADSISDIDSIIDKREERSLRKSELQNNINGFISCKQINLKDLPNAFIDKVMSKINKVRGFTKANATCITSVKLYQRVVRSIRKNHAHMYCIVGYGNNSSYHEITIS